MSSLPSRNLTLAIVVKKHTKADIKLFFPVQFIWIFLLWRNILFGIVDLFPDVDMHLFFEKATRVDVSYISRRFTKENNKDLTCHGHEKSTKYIAYSDKNNSNGYPLSKSLKNELV